MSFERAADAGQAEPRAIAMDHRRLQVLVSELLKTNQQLRFKVNELERRAEDAERGLAHACATASMLLP